jgi:hypothetical protein
LFSRVGQFTRNLTAPDPRARPAKTAATVFQVASSETPVGLPVPSPRRSLGEGSRSNSWASARQNEQPLQPLVLTKIDERKMPRTGSTSTPLPGEIQHRVTGSDTFPKRSPSQLRETRLRTTAPTRAETGRKTANRFLNWSQFPTRVRN